MGLPWRENPAKKARPPQKADFQTRSHRKFPRGFGEGTRGQSGRRAASLGGRRPPPRQSGCPRSPPPAPGSPLVPSQRGQRWGRHSTRVRGGPRGARELPPRRGETRGGGAGREVRAPVTRPRSRRPRRRDAGTRVGASPGGASVRAGGCRPDGAGPGGGVCRLEGRRVPAPGEGTLPGVSRPRG